MRREWSGWIRNREWSAFEALAKQDPHQQLADTVAELLLGMDEKADRKALKKVLFLLEQRGFVPTEHEAEQAVPTPDKKIFEFGFMSSADALGVCLLRYIRHEKDRALWVNISTHVQRGISRTTVQDVGLDDSERTLAKLRNSKADALIEFEVDPSYAKWRIAEAIRRTKPVPQDLVFHRSHFESAPEVTHPSVGLPVESVSDEDLRRLTYTIVPAMAWRLELGAAAPVILDLYSRIERDGVTAQEDYRNVLEEVQREHRSTLFTEAVVADHILRLKDLGYGLDRLGRKTESELVLGAAGDLATRGCESPYAVGVLEKTVWYLMETYRKRDQDKGKR